MTLQILRNLHFGGFFFFGRRLLEVIINLQPVSVGILKENLPDPVTPVCDGSLLPLPIAIRMSDCA
jgi:hypothetical protein